MTEFKRIIGLFKLTESPMCVNLLIGDRALVRLVSSWPAMQIVRFVAPDSGPVPDDDYGMWRWLWAHVNVDPRELSRCTGLDQEARRAFEVAKANRMIYPDGSINAHCANFLTGRVLKHLGVKSGPGRNPKEE